MPHRCLRCKEIYPDEDGTILRGCKCGSVFFVYIKTQKDAKKYEEIEKELLEKETTLEQELEKRFIQKKLKEEGYDIETIQVPKEGVYEINLEALMRTQNLIILKQGKTYLIHLPSIFEKVHPRT